MYNWDRENCPLYGVAGCPLFRGCLSIEVNGRAVGIFRIVHYIMGVRYSGVSVKRGSTVFQTILHKSSNCYCPRLATCSSCSHCDLQIDNANWGESERAPTLAGLHCGSVCMLVCLLACGHIL